MKIKVKNSGILKLEVHATPRQGDLFVAASMRNIPFAIKRAYFVNNIKDVSVVRGGHAHKKSTQAIFCVAGSFTLNLDDGKRKQKIIMNDPAVGVILGPKLWHTMSNFSKGCMFLVLASGHYDACDYYRNYEDFIKAVKK